MIVKDPITGGYEYIDGSPVLNPDTGQPVPPYDPTGGGPILVQDSSGDGTVLVDPITLNPIYEDTPVDTVDTVDAGVAAGHHAVPRQPGKVSGRAPRISDHGWCTICPAGQHCLCDGLHVCRHC